MATEKEIYSVDRFPVLLFAYNRPNHLQKTLDSLLANKGVQDTELYVYCDGPKNFKDALEVAKVKEIIEAISGFKKVIKNFSSENKGLANSVIRGVSEVLNENEAVIVLEDDIITNSSFLDFMQKALQSYKQRSDIFSVTAYNYPLDFRKDISKDLYLSYRSSSWGWGTWKSRWSKVDWSVGIYDQIKNDLETREVFERGGEDLFPMLEKQMKGEIDSWSIRFDVAHFENNATCLHPISSRVSNIGFDGTGAHSVTSTEYDVKISPDYVTIPNMPIDIAVDFAILEAFDNHFRPRFINGSTDAIKVVWINKFRQKSIAKIKQVFKLTKKYKIWEK